MNEALLFSVVLLWIVVVVLAAVVVALARQIGLLHERIAPVGALAMQRGPEAGEPAPTLGAITLDGEAITIGGPTADGRDTLLFFLSPSCPVCKTLLPTLERVAADAPAPVRLLLASDGDADQHRAFARDHGLDPRHYILSPGLGMAFAVAKLPYAALIDRDGILRAKGIVNTREHLESLFEAQRLGTPDLQTFLGPDQRPIGTTERGSTT